MNWLKWVFVGALSAVLCLVCIWFMEKEMHASQAAAQTVVRPPRPPQPPAPKAAPPQKAPEEDAPTAKAEAPKPRPAPERDGEARRRYAKSGKAFLGSGKTLDDLPEIVGESESVARYLAFASKAGWRFLAYQGGACLGEVELAPLPALKSADCAQIARRHSGKARQVMHEELLTRAAEAAASDGPVRLYAVYPPAFSEYLAGKILAQLQDLGLKPGEVERIHARWEIARGKAAAVFLSASAGGREYAIADEEAG